MSQVFYRKYRPQKFSEFVGQEHVVKTLTNAIANEMISHAYLFYGPRGSGKTTIARIFAKAINCQNRKKGEFEPCNKCSSCLEIIEGRSMDLIEIDAASHRGIEEVRELKDGIKFAPTKGKYKVYIIDESHQITKEAANALLKTLEEPPPHAVFILATTEIHKMIPTILSRCQRFDFKRLSLSEILKKIETICQKEKIDIEKPALELIAKKAEGSMRDAESLLDQIFTLFGNKKITLKDVREILGMTGSQTIIDFTDLLLKKDEKGAIEFLNDLFEKGEDLTEFIKAEIDYLRKILILKIVGENENPYLSGLTKEEIQKMKEQSLKIKEESLKKILEIFLEAQNKIKYSPIPQLPLELAIVEVVKWLSGQVDK
jgi:DNA polymerase-3 subunit gamma/tau